MPVVGGEDKLKRKKRGRERERERDRISETIAHLAAAGGGHSRTVLRAQGSLVFHEKREEKGEKKGEEASRDRLVASRRRIRGIESRISALMYTRCIHGGEDAKAYATG